MIRKSLSRAVGLAAAIIFISTLASAQMGQVEGTVRLSEAGGKKPVAGALIDIYRTDVKGHWDTKTDRNGHYIHLGLPLAGSFVFIVSGPGIAPTYTQARITQMPVVDFTVDPGDGRTLTLEEVQKAMKSGGGGPAPGKTPPPADRAKAEAAQKEQEVKVQEAKALQTTFDQARVHYNTGLDMLKANLTAPDEATKTSNYSNALSEFEQAASVDPAKHAAMKLVNYRANANVSEVHYQLGVDLFNKRKRDEAKPHFVAAVAAAKKAIVLASDDTAENNPSLNSDLIIYYNILAKNAMLLIEYYGAADLIEDTVKDMGKAEALDVANKNKWGVLKADLYRSAGRTEDAVAAYKAVIAADPNNFDALYGLGLTLIASTERAQIQEGANTLAEFVVKAPPTDKRVPIVKDALEGVKNAYKVEAEKPAAPARRKRP
jgi:tetratricopeptide (TPR) repeat protein